ncbi:NACHT domain-containing protein [Kitasatospora sp. MMS16-BH015]|uniref:NACHT domain-containing protein n=1 Tax=Kitasatospora sp. MMS16-BH015 TaxID=2018025 RepID=UPI000CA35CAA|nr:NACHT domain-containing protein [Kitasatospora sp. MMS16-BH015]AUG78006.1 NACHT domain-containing protein [Kitasatospora sp. MMS16-BH015]
MPVPERVVAVRAAQQGSGFLLTPRLVLTAAHPLGGLGTAEVASPGGTGWQICRVVSRDMGLDVALLLAQKPIVHPATEFDELRWVSIDGLEPLAGCHLTGYPAASRRSADLDSFQAFGSLTPGSGLNSRRHLLSLDQHPPVGADAGSPWAGLSGAVLLRDDNLLGVVISDYEPSTWGSSQLTVVPAHRILTSPPLAAAFDAHLAAMPRVERITATNLADAAFEREHAEAVRADYGRIRIFGLRQSNRRGWELDTAYLSLEAARTEARHHVGSGRVEHLLAGRRRVLLRGQAGSGKTTLVQWLAVHAAAGTMGPELAELNHRVPLVLQLRKLFRQGVMQPRPEEFLRLDDRMCADRQPVGWAHRVLGSGRALLLVDGLDEVPAAQRDEALEWLERLLDHYPQLWTVATVRPAAVPPGWLDHLDFTELSLRPMNDTDRTLFIERWHRAALAETLAARHTPEEAAAWRREIEQDQAGLLRALQRSSELNQLADSPLLCAMLCALNRESAGVLPQRRMEIYRDAMTMMLVKRDETRRVDGPEQLRLSEEEQIAILRRLANWMVRNSKAEATREDAVFNIEKALRDLPSVARQGNAEQVYLHLLNRTGLLAQTSVDTFQFVHRTFQDYLAAIEFKEERDFGVLASRAWDEQWHDVIRLTVGHCGKSDRDSLLNEILRVAEAGPDEGFRARLHLMAGSCLPYAPEIGSETREVVLAGVADGWRSMALLDLAGELFALVGEDMIPILREALRAGGPRAIAFDVAGLVGGPQALDLLAEAADSGFPAGGIVRQWDAFDHREFARRVLSRVDLSRLRLEVSSATQLSEVGELSPVHRVLLYGDGVADSAQWAALAGSVTELALLGMRAPVDLTPLAGWPALRVLDILSCSGVGTLDGLPEATSLRELEVGASRLAAWGDRELSPYVERLVVGGVDGRCPPELIHRQFPNLVRLVVTTDDPATNVAYTVFAERHGIELDLA